MGRIRPPNRHFLDIPLANGHVAPQHSRHPSSILTSREETTRVQLQKQRLQEQHHAVVVSQRIPGFKTSAAFFASLRTNLRLNASPPPSPLSTPQSMRGSVSPLPPPSPLAIQMDPPLDQADAAPAEDPMAGVPELTTYMTEDPEERTKACILVADSVAQMRNAANRALLFHPLNMAIGMAIISLLARYVYEWKRDTFVAASSCTGFLMTAFAMCRYLTQGYIERAESTNMDWLGNADVIITKFGDEIIGTVITDWISGESRQKRKKAWRGEIKGWAVRLKYRGKGVGAALLEEAVKESKKKGAETIEFADDHANSLRLLPKFYNGQMDKREKKAHELLQELLEMSPTRTRRKRGGST